MAAILEISHVSRRFGQLLANDDISLSLKQGEILALLGENGAGKTTLMNILFGHYAADSGVIRVAGKELPAESTDAALKAGVGMVHQHFTLADNMTVLENIMLGTESLWSVWSNRTAASRKLEAIADELQLQIELNTLVADLSIGQRQRVEILKALYREARILILDEPTAVLTPQEVDSLFALLRRMADDGMAIVIITHKLHEVLDVSQRVAVLRHGKMVGTANTEDVDRDELARMIVGHDVKRPSLEPLEPGPEVLGLYNISVTDGNSHIESLKEVNLCVHRRQIVGLAGVSGNGQAALAAVISGITRATSGVLKIDGEAVKSLTPAKLAERGVARIPEDRHSSGVIGEMSIWENLMLEDLGKPPCWRAGSLLNHKAARQRAASLIAAFDIRCASMEQPARLLSGGNIQKLILARNFQRQPSFVLANQPARGLDEGAIAFVHEQLLLARKNGAGILLISEDLDELLRLSDSIVVMHAGTLSQAMAPADLSARDIGVLMTGGSLSSDRQSGFAA